MFRMKNVVGAVTLATMIGSSAFAASAEAPLAPGKPAGVHKAELSTGAIAIAAVGAGILAAIAITVSQTPGDRTGSQSSFSTAATGAAP